MKEVNEAWARFAEQTNAISMDPASLRVIRYAFYAGLLEASQIIGRAGTRGVGEIEKALTETYEVCTEVLDSEAETHH